MGSLAVRALLWGGLTADLRLYRTLWPGRLSAALRLAGDLILGRPPFYELSEIGGPRPFSATGGAIGLRGVLARRFHGLGKVLTNLELRALAFSDLGLVFADPLRRSIEGPPRLGMGLGGGLRLLWGKTFLVRADYGVSPTDGTTGFYLDLGHVF
ncbi:MAG: hypothetical protein P1V51_11565 [Deltaproteobacteria bacterium]|nr:hypothetical protein [Deltaproteobacteria bacterium]